MSKQEIERIIVKFLNREANIQELEKLDFLLKDDRNSQDFNHFVWTEYITTVSMAEYDVDKAKKAIKYKLKINKRKRRFMLYKRVAIAASIVLVVFLGLFKGYDNDQTAVVSTKNPVVIEAGSNKAILTLENGNQVALEKGKKYHTGKAESDGEELVYTLDKEIKNSDHQIEYNYLTIPRGAQFFVQLSDGTKVWLNSESKLKYPVEFQKGKTRNVELVYGEAYFKVSPSSEHNGAEFHVRTKYQQIAVLGTEFNIKSYNSIENDITTTLVEGEIQVQIGEMGKILKPNQQSKTRSDSDLIAIKEVDVSMETSWINGLFTFNEESLDEIMNVLSRWYNVEVIFETAKQKEFVFTGIVERTESIDHILKLIEATSEGQIKFEISDRTITIK